MSHKKAKSYILVTIMTILVLFVVGCGVKQDPYNNAVEPVRAIDLNVWGTTNININPLNTTEEIYDLQALTTEFPITVSVGNTHGYTVKVNGMEMKSNEVITFPVPQIRPDITIPIEITDQNGSTITKYMRTLNSKIDVRTFGKSEDEGFYYFNHHSFNCKMDTSGNIVYYSAGNNAFNFRPHQVGDKVYYSYFVNYQPDFDCGNMKAIAIVLDDKYTLYDRIELLDTSEGMPENQGLDDHEFLMLGPNHYIVTSYVVKRVNNIPKDVKNYSEFGSRVVAAVIQERKDGELIYQWDSTEHPELYAMSTDDNDFLNEYRFYADYAHINSVEVDPSDNNLIVSLRNTSSIIKISRQTGDIIWVLGGNADEFGLAESQKTSAQHDARISPRGTLTVFDNGLVMPVGITNPFVDTYHTRVVEYELDEINKKLISFKEYSVPGTCSPIMGSARLLDPKTDTFLIGWGGRRPGSALFSEVNFSTKDIIFEAYSRDESIAYGTYRAYKYDR